MNIEPKLLKKIDITEAGGNCRVLLGDVDGDGRLEMVLMQCDTGFDDRYYPHEVTCLTAYDMEGKILWQTGTPDRGMPGGGADIPAQIYDIDNDGFNEILCVMNDKFCILDGKNGQLKKSYDLPDQHAHDCIIIANLSGNEVPQDIILKDRYNKIWAMDKDFNLMWTFEGNVGHYPYPYDLNGDGRDELIAGYSVLDGDGKLLWKIDMSDHADCIWVGDLFQDGNVQVVVGGEDTTAYSADGKLIWRYSGTVESQNIALGNFRADLKGTEVGGLDRIDRTSVDGIDGMFLVDCNGKELYKEQRDTRGWSSITAMIHNWDKKDSDNLFSYRRGAGILPTIYDGFMNAVTVFPIDGQVMWADIAGDGIPQVFIYDNDEVLIFSNGEKDISKAVINEPRPQIKRLYNWTRYWGSEMPISRYAVNYVTKIFENSDVLAWAKDYIEIPKADANEVMNKADFVVMLVKALDLKAYIRKNYSDVKVTDYYYNSVGIAKKIGITGDTEKFEPKSEISIATAIEMIEKAMNKSFEVKDMDCNHTLTRIDVARLLMNL